jgi:ketosteroid isomerase-like protein
VGSRDRLGYVACGNTGTRHIPRLRRGESLFEDWFSTFPFEEWEQELNDVIDCGEDRVVALTRQRGRGSASGVSVELEYAQVITLREGKMVRVDVYLDRERALEAAGLTE